MSDASAPPEAERAPEMAKILVIEDNDAMRRLVSRVLTDAGHQVVEAADGREGVRLFESEAPEIVITDIVMPEQEGIGTIRSIRGRGTDVAIIAMSGGGAAPASVYLQWAGELGADDTLAKPFHPAELVTAVTRLLNRDRRAKSLSRIWACSGTVH